MTVREELKMLKERVKQLEKDVKQLEKQRKSGNIEQISSQIGAKLLKLKCYETRIGLICGKLGVRSSEIFSTGGQCLYYSLFKLCCNHVVGLFKCH